MSLLLRVLVAALFIAVAACHHDAPGPPLLARVDVSNAEALFVAFQGAHPVLYALGADGSARTPATEGHALQGLWGSWSGGELHVSVATITNVWPACLADASPEWAMGTWMGEGLGDPDLDYMRIGTLLRRATAASARSGASRRRACRRR